MISRNISLPELALIAGTRVALGAGLGLLLADQFKPEQRRTIGRRLLAVGLLTTIPLAADVLLRHRNSNHSHHDDDDASTDLNEMISSRSTL